MILHKKYGAGVLDFYESSTDPDPPSVIEVVLSAWQVNVREERVFPHEAVGRMRRLAEAIVSVDRVGCIACMPANGQAHDGFSNRSCPTGLGFGMT